MLTAGSRPTAPATAPSCEPLLPSTNAREIRLACAPGQRHGAALAGGRGLGAGGLPRAATADYRPLPAGPARHQGRTRRIDERGAADAVGTAAGLRLRPAAARPAGRPHRPAAGADRRPRRLRRVGHRLPAGAEHRGAGRVARAAGPVHGSRGGLRAGDGARPVPAARRHARAEPGAVRPGRDRAVEPAGRRPRRDRLRLARCLRGAVAVRDGRAGLRRARAARDRRAQEPGRHPARPAAGGLRPHRARPDLPGLCQPDDRHLRRAVHLSRQHRPLPSSRCLACHA